MHLQSGGRNPLCFHPPEHQGWCKRKVHLGERSEGTLPFLRFEDAQTGRLTVRLPDGVAFLGNMCRAVNCERWFRDEVYDRRCMVTGLVYEEFHGRGEEHAWPMQHRRNSSAKAPSSSFDWCCRRSIAGAEDHQVELAAASFHAPLLCFQPWQKRQGCWELSDESNLNVAPVEAPFVSCKCSGGM